MGGLVEALLGAGIGASTAAVNNAKHDQQQMDADAAEQRVMNRETALMYLRNKYAKDLAEHSDGLARGRAKFENNLRLDSLNDKRVTQAEDRKRQSEIDDYDIKSGIDMEKWTNQNSITHNHSRCDETHHDATDNQRGLVLCKRSLCGFTRHRETARRDGAGSKAGVIGLTHHGPRSGVRDRSYRHTVTRSHITLDISNVTEEPIRAIRSVTHIRETINRLTDIPVSGH
jgi:hypothetical protein